MSPIYQDNLFKEAFLALKNKFPIKKALLFGSRAKGTYTKDSDYDLLLIIKKTNLTVLERMQETGQVLLKNKINIPTDFFIYKEEEFNKNKTKLDTIHEVAFTGGTEIDLGKI